MLFCFTSKSSLFSLSQPQFYLLNRNNAAYLTYDVVSLMTYVKKKKNPWDRICLGLPRSIPQSQFKPVVLAQLSIVPTFTLKVSWFG